MNEIQVTLKQEVCYLLNELRWACRTVF